MEKEKNSNDKKAIIIFSIILAVILVPIIISSITSSIRESQEINHETKLIQEGKTESASEVLDKIIKVLKDRDEKEIDKLLSKDFTYWNNENYESKSISGFWRDLKYYTGKYYTEKRGNSLKDQETYWIYWDIPEKIDYNQYADYCLQRIVIYLKRVVKKDIITYEVEKIILKNN